MGGVSVSPQKLKSNPQRPKSKTSGLRPTTATSGIDSATFETHFKLGDYVKIVGLVANTDLNGQIGIIIPKRNPLEKERVSVRVFTSPPPGSDGFGKRDISIRPSNLMSQQQPQKGPNFDITRKVLAALYARGPSTRRVLNGDSRSAIQNEVLSVLEDAEKLTEAIEMGEQALAQQDELAVFVDTLILCLCQ